MLLTSCVYGSGGVANAAAAITFVQVASGTPRTPTPTVSVAYPRAQTSGDLNVVVVGWNDTTTAVQSVKDSAGNTYRLAIGPTSGTALRQSIYYSPSIKSGSNTVTVTFSQAAPYPDVRILEYRGVATLDVTAGASGDSMSANSGSATTKSANELIIGADTIATMTGAAGSGFTSRIITSPDGNIAEDKVVTTMGSKSATASLTSSGPWVMQMVTFSAAAAPAALSGLTCSSASMTGAGSDDCTVTLSAAAASGGQSVSLASSNAAVTVPATVTVPANATSAGFTASVSLVTSAQSVTLTASAGSVSKSFALHLNAAGPMLSIDPTSVAFGNVEVNTASTQTVTLSSTGTAAVTVSAAPVKGTGFTVSGSTLPVTLNPGKTATLNVQFDPTAAGAVAGNLTIQSNSSTGGTAVISLSGTGTPPVVNLSWDAPSSSTDPVAGYNIYRSAGGSSSYQLLNSSIDTETTYVDTTVRSGTAYTYYLESVDSAGVVSAPSNEVTVTIP